MIFNFRNKTILGYPKNETQNQQLGANGVIKRKTIMKYKPKIFS